METAVELGIELGNQALACRALLFPKATLYRHLAPKKERIRKPRPPSSRAVPPETRQEILAHLHGEEFVDRSPSEAFHTLLDRGLYFGSIRTYYRILNANGEVKDRRNRRRHIVYPRPELVATGPNQVWTWDIVRHEAFSDRAEVKDLRGPPVAAVGHKLRAARTGERRER